jgi:hypothetical protein
MRQSKQTPSEQPSQTKLSIAQREGHHFVITLEQIPAGAVVLELLGRIVDRPTRYSIQVSERLHLAPPRNVDRTTGPDQFPWRFLNHACDPNAAISVGRLLALRAIDAGEEITFDYNTTEYEMAEPFVCLCGNCDGRTVAGFRHLDAVEQERLRPRLSDHLLRSATAASPSSHSHAPIAGPSA